MKNAIARQRDSSIILHKNIDSNSHAIENHNMLLRKISNELFRAENEIESEQTELHDFIELDMLLDTLIEIVDSMEDIMRDGKIGRCNLKGFSKEFLISNLRKLESNRKGMNPIFASWEWESYYHHELCTVALNREELWITMRIPIVKHSDRMARIIPKPSFMWARSFLNDLAIDAFFFKDIEHEMYSVITTASYELCSHLGNIRVCNVRKTRFSEQQRMVVPVDLNRNKILLLSNMTGNSSIKIDTECNSHNIELNLNEFALIRIPDDCHVKTKEFEIEMKLKNEIMQDQHELDIIKIIEYKLLHRNSTKERIEVKTDEKVKPSLDFERSTNLTNEALNRIVVNHEGIFDDLKLMKIGRLSTTVCLLGVGGIVLLLFVRRYCSSGHETDRNSIQVHIGNPEKDEKVMTTQADREVDATTHEVEHPQLEGHQIPIDQIINKQFAKPRHQ
jgi:hypothetical protein